MTNQKPIRQIIDHPINARWQKFYECPSESRKDTSYVVASNTSTDEWGCSCPRWIFKRAECKHIRSVKLFLVFANERKETIISVKVAQMPQKTQKAVSRFSMVEV
jgi:hypothetical protein